MTSIVEYRVTQVEIEDRRDVTENIVRDKIFLKTSEQATWADLRQSQLVPKWNQPHPREPGFFLEYIKPKQVSQLCWELEAEYSTIKAGQESANPLARPAAISFDSSLVEQPTFFDVKKQLITTTAGELITGVMQQIPILDYVVKKNLPSDPDWLKTHIGGVNRDPIKLRGLLWEPKTLLLGGVSGGDFVTENRTEYTPYTLKILADPRGWAASVWNRGTVYLQKYEDRTGKTSYRQVRIKQGDPPEDVTEPVPLDRSGQVIEGYLSASETPVDPSKLVTLVWDVQKEVSFAELPLR